MSAKVVVDWMPACAALTFAVLRLWVCAVNGSMTARSSGCSAERPLNRPRRRAGGSTAVAVTPEFGDLNDSRDALNQREALHKSCVILVLAV